LEADAEAEAEAEAMASRRAAGSGSPTTTCMVVTRHGPVSPPMNENNRAGISPFREEVSRASSGAAKRPPLRATER